jgi:hypothetical protein
MQTIKQQLQRNSVAFISLFIALSSLAYNTWRNETTEDQRNVRHAAFQVIEKLGELQSVVNAMVYSPQRAEDGWIDGWGKVLATETLGSVMPEPIPTESERLKLVWTSQFEALSAEPEAAREADRKITAQIEATKMGVLEVLEALD